jgi:hypothetical protein
MVVHTKDNKSKDIIRLTEDSAFEAKKNSSYRIVWQKKGGGIA